MIRRAQVGREIAGARQDEALGALFPGRDRRPVAAVAEAGQELGEFLRARGIDPGCAGQDPAEASPKSVASRSALSSSRILRRRTSRFAAEKKASVNQARNSRGRTRNSRTSTR